MTLEESPRTPLKIRRVPMPSTPSSVPEHLRQRDLRCTPLMPLFPHGSPVHTLVKKSITWGRSDHPQLIPAGCYYGGSDLPVQDSCYESNFTITRSFHREHITELIPDYIIHYRTNFKVLLESYIIGHQGRSSTNSSGNNLTPKVVEPKLGLYPTGD
jgi:hypothetical protein